VSLKDFLDGASDDAEKAYRMEALFSFHCVLDSDIEHFLHHRAIDFDNRGWCSVYLLLDEAALENRKYHILAYFTLSHKAMVPHTISKSKIKTVTGGLKDADSLHFVLIGQLGKHIEEMPDGSWNIASVHLTEILDYAFEIIEESSALIPCRCVLIECDQERTKLHQLYKNYGFKLLQQDDNLLQFYKPL